MYVVHEIGQTVWQISVWCTHTNSYSWLGWLVVLACLIFLWIFWCFVKFSFFGCVCFWSGYLWCVCFLLGPSWFLWRSVVVKAVFIEVWWLHTESIRLRCGYVHTHIYIYIWTHHSQIDKNVNIICYHHPVTMWMAHPSTRTCVRVYQRWWHQHRRLERP